MMLALMHFQIIPRESAETREIISHGIFAENVIVHEDLEIASKTGHTAQSKICFFADNAMAVW